MTTKLMQVNAACAIILGVLIFNPNALAEDKPADAQKKAIRWIDTTDFFHWVSGMKKEIVLDAETAGKLFSKDESHLREDWQKHVPAKIENAADAVTFSDHVYKIWIPAKQEEVQAAVAMYSEKELIVRVLQYKGQCLAHTCYECKGNFRIPRSKEVDELFDVASLEKSFGAEYKGLKHGDSEEDVVKKLGKPDERKSFQLTGYQQLRYSRGGVTIAIKHGRIQAIWKPDPIENDVKPSKE